MNGDFTPPLVQQLFHQGQAFNKILAGYPSVEAIADDFRTKISRKQSLEGLLKQLQEKADISRKRQYWEIPLYLQELLWEISANYVISGSTRFHTLVNAIVDSKYEKVLFLTLNYDLFLEKALESIERFQWTSLGSYGRTDSRWCVVKLHGSVHWGKQLMNQPTGVSHWVHVLQNLEEPPKLADAIQILDNSRASSRFIGGQFYYPALGIPFEGKKEFHCPPEHIELARRFMSECTDYLVIGFSAFDAHVLELFESVHQVHKLMIVNGTKESGRDALQRIGPHCHAIKQSWILTSMAVSEISLTTVTMKSSFQRNASVPRR